MVNLDEWLFHYFAVTIVLMLCWDCMSTLYLCGIESTSGLEMR